MTGLTPSLSLSSLYRAICPAIHFRVRTLLLWAWIGLSLFSSHLLASQMPLVVVTQKPLTLLLTELVDDSAILVQLIPDGASPHEFSLSWSGRRQLADADLVVWGGAALEPQLASVIGTLPAEKVLDASTAVVDWAVAEQCHGHGSGPESAGSAHSSVDHAHHSDDHHPSSPCVDPHFWLNPHNMSALAEVVTERLASLKALDSGQLHDVAQALLDRIEALDRRAHEILAPLNASFYVVEHDAYNHFSQHYGLMQPGFLRAGHGVPIGPRSFSRLLARNDIVCVYTEPEYSPKLAQRLAENTGAALQKLDPLGSEVDLALGYTGLMTRFVNAFASCLSPEGAGALNE